jgi:hypothetical protein
LRNRKGIVYVLVVLAVLALVATVALAAEAVENGDPWEGVLVTFGGVTLAWSGVQMALLQLLKSIKVGDEPLLNSSGLIWLVNAMLGAVGLIIAATQGGTPLLVAAIQALIAVFAASGEFEALKKAGVVSGNSQSSSTSSSPPAA